MSWRYGRGMFSDDLNSTTPVLRCFPAKAIGRFSAATTQQMRITGEVRSNGGNEFSAGAFTDGMYGCAGAPKNDEGPLRQGWL
jgi:hypothetical protein